VAVRRTRSALSQIKQVFEPEVVEKYREEFGWLGQITGPTRDLDVYLLEYESYRDSLPAAMRGDLAPFHAFLERSQKKAQRVLKRQLDGERFAALRQDWRRFLQQPVVGVPSAANAALPVKSVADRRIWRMYKRVLREGRAITPESPAEDLHELRKSCKKLRYLIEFFISLYDQKSIRPLVKALKRLLDNLGEFQDLEVHAEHLHDFAAQMQKQGEVPLETLLAMGALVGGLLQRQQSARQAFAQRFEGFDTRDNRAAYRRLFKPHPVGDEEARA
jgi:CHAD domain-containing protein